eukprot:2684190-Rhodomonas_salina.1
MPDAGDESSVRPGAPLEGLATDVETVSLPARSKVAPDLPSNCPRSDPAHRYSRAPLFPLTRAVAFCHARSFSHLLSLLHSAPDGVGSAAVRGQKSMRAAEMHGVT